VTKVLGTRHFGGSLANFPFTHTQVYIAVSALVLNIVVAVVVTVVLKAIKAPEGTDVTSPADYYADPAPKRSKRPSLEPAADPATP
jgi:SSS family solute:Na+ symporter